MLIPQFRCSQDAEFVRVEIKLTALCKVADAQFDITERQFTFHCAPYFLRLVFPHELTEGRGERATYDVETCMLTVQLPKMNPGEEFPGLEYPNQMLATRKQRKRLVADVDSGGAAAAAASAASNGNDVSDPSESGLKATTAGGAEDDDVNAADDDDEERAVQDDADADADAQVEAGSSDDGDNNNNGKDDDEDDDLDGLDTEFDQYLQLKEQDEREKQVALVSYGFNNHFSGFFAPLDPGMVREVVDLPGPDATPEDARTALRRAAEDVAYDEEAFLCSMADDDGDVEGGVLPYKPWYVVSFETELRAAGRPEHHRRGMPAAEQQQAEPAPPRPISIAVDEEDEEALTNDALATKVASTAVAVIWRGNGDINPVEENADTNPTVAAAAAAASSAPAAAATAATPATANPFVPRPAAVQRSTRGGLAYPMPPPPVDFTLAESTALAAIPRRNFLLQSEAACMWALCDVLAATVYDVLTTQGAGNVESCWTVTKLSTCLSWLDPPRGGAKDFADGFCRRVLVYPLHRHFGLALRCLRDVSVLLLSGPRACVKALLYAKNLVDASDSDSGKHCLSTLWLNPMLSWLTTHSAASLHELMVRTADALHAYVVRGELEGSATAGVEAGAVAATVPAAPVMQRTLNPLSWTALALPFSSELLEQVN